MNPTVRSKDMTATTFPGRHLAMLCVWAAEDPPGPGPALIPRRGAAFLQRRGPQVETITVGLLSVFAKN